MHDSHAGKVQATCLTPQRTYFTCAHEQIDGFGIITTGGWSTPSPGSPGGSGGTGDTKS